jgi:pimeloyl-ACP methyl ester carboxylesterase
MKIIFLLLVSMFISSCSHVYYQPQKKHYVDPAQFKLTYEDVYFPSADKTILHGWFFSSGGHKPKGTIVHFHGNAQNLSTHFLNLIWLVKEGYDLLVFDYRGYGKSKGEPGQEGIYHDALAAMDKGYELYIKRKSPKLIIYGQSLGGIISLRALPDFKHVDDVALMVQDSTFSSYTDIGFDVLARRWFLMPFSPLAYVLVSDKYGSYNVLDKIKTPTLVIVGQKDEVIPQKFGKEIFKKIHPTKKWLWKLPNGGHIDIFHHDKGIYRKMFLDLVDGIGQG